jgi:serine-type D-Ala-D-Ala carboxypeptidase (penicillin-binding protein 5/6)
VTRRVARGAAALLPLVVLVAQLTALGGPRAQTAPPPTPVPPNGSPSPFVSKLRTPADPLPEPAVDARAAILMDIDSGQVLVERAPGAAQPIASLTKVMTALLVLTAEEGRLDRRVRVHADAVFERGDYGSGSVLGLRAAERVSVRGLLAGLLLGSANDAAEALAIAEAGSVSAFVDRMNARAAALGMSRTRFASPHGLDDRGRSSAADLMVLFRRVWAIPAFRDLVGRQTVVVRSNERPARRIQNRNVLLWLYPGASGVKTGFTAGAGYCLLATARRGDRSLAVVVLGGRDEVFSDAAALLNHGFAAFEEASLVAEGESLGSAAVRGGDVPIVAGATLVGLVPSGSIPTIDRRVTISPDAAYPPPAGATIGSVRLSLAGTTLGRVPVVVGDLEAPVPPDGSWWSRATGAVASAVAGLVGDLMGSPA